MTTVVNSFGFQGVTGTFQPTTHNWVPRDLIGVDGAGHGVYPAVREYELTWDFLDASEYNTLYGYFLAVGTTGSVVSMLPKYPPTPNYEFYAYSGTVLREPTFKDFFENYYTDVKLLIVNILT